MSCAQLSALKRQIAYALLLIISSIGLSLHGFGGQQHIKAQAADSMYLTPASGSFAAGSSFTVTIKINTSNDVNAAEAKLTYPSNLEYISVDGSNSAFGIDASSTGGNGSVSISRAGVSAVSGEQILSKVTFKAVSAGSASVEMLETSKALSNSTYENVITSRSGGAYSIQGSLANSSPTSVSPPAATPPSAPMATNQRPSTSPSISSRSNSRNTIAAEGSTQVTPLPGDSVIELKAPATIETSAGDAKQITKVEYLLNGRVVTIDATPPYSHSIDTKSMRNGRYTLVTKTYFASGSPELSNVSLDVKNPLSLQQIWLQLRHYAWLVIILVIIIGEVLYLKLFRKPTRPKYPDLTGNAAGPSTTARQIIQPVIIRPQASNQQVVPNVIDSSLPGQQPH